MNSTTNEKESLPAWLDGNRIKSTELLHSLEQLGATEVSDLKDLSKEDISSFQPPFLKKLEYVRFERGIQCLKESSHDKGKVIHLVTESSSSTTSCIPRTVSVPPSQNEITFERPPLPAVCPGEGCSGVLSSHLGSRKNKYLTELDGPDFRWIVTCDTCSRKWHACHFLCGHLQKISILGSSDIIRHEQGRFNRWQKKIKPPCVKNPKGGFLQATYIEQKNKSKLSSDSTSSMSGSITISTTPSLINPNNPQFDNEFKSMLGSLDEGTLNFNDFEGTERVNTEFLLETGKPDCIEKMTSSTRESGEPSHKKVKLVVTSPGPGEHIDDDILDLCHEIQGKCLLREIRNLYKKHRKR